MAEQDQVRPSAWEPGPDAGGWFEEASVGLLAATPEGRILRGNRILRKWVGRSSGELAGRLWFELLLPRAGRMLAETLIYPLLAANGRAEQVALELVDAQDRRRPCLLQVQVERAGAGGPAWHRITFLPAADRSEYECQLLQAKRAAEDATEQLRELNLDLERRVRERTAELAAANRELDTFVHSVSHDLRGPLQVILALGAVLQAGAESGLGLDEKQRNSLARILQAAGTMRDLIAALLQMARDTGDCLQPGPVDLSAIARRVRADLETAEPARRVAWEIEAGLRAWADPRLMEAVLRNLLGNAWKYSSQTLSGSPAAALRGPAETHVPPEVRGVGRSRGW